VARQVQTPILEGKIEKSGQRGGWDWVKKWSDTCPGVP